MEAFVRENWFSILSVVACIATMLIHLGITRQRILAMELAIQTFQTHGTPLSQKLGWQIAEAEKQVLELRHQHSSTATEITDLKVELSSITTKLDAIMEILKRRAS